MGRNTTGPSRAAPGELRCAVECYRRRQTTTDASEQKTTLAPTLCVGRPVITIAKSRERTLRRYTNAILLLFIIIIDVQFLSICAPSKGDISGDRCYP